MNDVLLNRRREMMQASNASYTIYDYIWTNGGTGEGDNTKNIFVIPMTYPTPNRIEYIKAEFKLYPNKSFYTIAARLNNIVGNGFCVRYIHNTGVQFWLGSNIITLTNFNSNGDNVFEYDGINRRLRLNDGEWVSYTMSNVQGLNGDVNFGIFKTTYASSIGNSMSAGYFKSLHMIAGSEVMLVPAMRNADSAIGILDTISETFYEPLNYAFALHVE